MHNLFRVNAQFYSGRDGYLWKPFLYLRAFNTSTLIDWLVDSYDESAQYDYPPVKEVRIIYFFMYCSQEEDMIRTRTLPKLLRVTTSPHIETTSKLNNFV